MRLWVLGMRGERRRTGGHSEIGKSIDLDNDGEERRSCSLRISKEKPFANEVSLYSAAVVRAFK